MGIARQNTDDQIQQETVAESIGAIRLPAVEIRKALDPAYWKRLGGGLSVGDIGEIEDLERATLPESACVGARDKLATQGYFEIGPMFRRSSIAAMRKAVESVRTAGWPAVFAFVYDQFWTVFRGPAMTALLTSVLGERYRQIGHVWAYYLEPKAGVRGWPPHIDSGDAGARVTIWVPLTDATVHNGCMFLIPRNAVSSLFAAKYREGQGIESNELLELLHNVRALPAAAGSALGWSHDILHWGSVVTGSAEGPRISIAAEFLGDSATAARTDYPLFQQRQRPPFAQRLFAIGAALFDYRSFESQLAPFEDLGKELMNRTEKEFQGEGM